MSHSPDVLAVVERVVTLCERVTKNARLEPMDLVAELGTLKHETGRIIYVQPDDRRFPQAFLGREPDGSLRYVELMLATATEGVASALKARFGDPVFPPAVGRGPLSALWAVDEAPERPVSCWVVAKFEVTPGDDLSGAVTFVSVQVVPR
jgi:hypothetical protein